MAVEELNGEVKFSTHLPYPNNLSRWRLLLSVRLSVRLQWVNNVLVNANKQDVAGADGGAAAADAQVGSSAERRAGQLGH